MFRVLDVGNLAESFVLTSNRSSSLPKSDAYINDFIIPPHFHPLSSGKSQDSSSSISGAICKRAGDSCVSLNSLEPRGAKWSDDIAAMRNEFIYH